jgi:hypothetical protein
LDSYAEIVSSFANLLAVIVVFGALFAIVLEIRDESTAAVPTIAPVLAALGVFIFLAGNVLRYVLAAF